MYAALATTLAFVTVALVTTTVVVDPGTVQSVAVAEILDDASCPRLLDKDGRLCGRGRRFELRRGERDRALALINAAVGEPRVCKDAPTHAFVLATTKGPKIIEVSFRCHTINGQAFAGTTEQEAAGFFRAQGLVTGL